MEARLKSGIWVQVLVRRCDLAAIGVAVVARGDSDAGAILLKLSGSGRDRLCTVLAQARGPDGALVWMRATGAVPVAEADADAYIARQRGRDPDLWVVEIESGSPDAVLDTPIIA
jgi:hypothetical protein